METNIVNVTVCVLGRKTQAEMYNEPFRYVLQYSVMLLLKLDQGLWSPMYIHTFNVQKRLCSIDHIIIHTYHKGIGSCLVTYVITTYICISE